MNKESINKNLWDIIHVHYEKECYTDCLKDACLYIIQLIQEKSEIEDLDGEKLITTVFSEKNPKLLINDNQTQTEKDEQRGFGFLLRGFICSIRNPISHNNNFKFTKDEADSILMFMSNYIIPRLDDSKDFSYVEDWYKFIFRDNENDSNKFSQLLLENIPKKEKYSLMIEIIEKMYSIKKGKYAYFINQLFDSLSSKEKKDIIIILNKKLIKAGDDNSLRMFFNHFDTSIWSSLDKLVRARIEELVFDDISSGKVYYEGEEEICKGTLGTWTSNWINVFENKNEIIELLFRKLNSDIEGQYVCMYFSDVFTEEILLKNCSKVINGLKRGKSHYKEILEPYMLFEDENDEVVIKFKELFDNFKEEDPLS